MALNARRTERPIVTQVGTTLVSDDDANYLENAWTDAQADPSYLLAIDGTEDEREDQVIIVKAWALSHEPRVTARLYSHPSLPKGSTYIQLQKYQWTARKGSNKDDSQE